MALAERFEAGAEVNQTSLIVFRLRPTNQAIKSKLLAQGDIAVALNLQAHAISAAAKEKTRKSRRHRWIS